LSDFDNSGVAASGGRCRGRTSSARWPRSFGHS